MTDRKYCYKYPHPAVAFHEGLDPARNKCETVRCMQVLTAFPRAIHGARQLYGEIPEIIQTECNDKLPDEIKKVIFDLDNVIERK